MQNTLFTEDKPSLTSYDWIVVNSSAGKDSQAMLDVVCVEAKSLGILSRVVVVHADLGRMEWQGTKELAMRQAAHYGVRFEVVKRRTKDKQDQTLLEHVRDRRMWPSSRQRYCTSDHKRGPVTTVFTGLADEIRLAQRKRVRILNCMGMRSQESPKRAKMVPFSNDPRNTNGRRHVDIWLPIHGWTVAQVWERIHASGVEYHYAYKLGMPRLSCVFCIFSPKNALLLAGKHNRPLLREYVQVEKEIDHKFRQDLSLAEIEAELEAGAEPGRVSDWVM